MFYAIYGFKITLEEGKIKCDCPALDDDSGQKAVLIGII